MLELGIERGREDLLCLGDSGDIEHNRVDARTAWPIHASRKPDQRRRASCCQQATMFQKAQRINTDTKMLMLRQQHLAV
jgi:hypothetical protein